MRKYALWGVISPKLSDRASDIRKPHPYNIVKMAESRKPCHSSLPDINALSIKSIISLKSKDLGMLLSLRGDVKIEISSFFIVEFSSAQR